MSLYGPGLGHRPNCRILRRYRDYQSWFKSTNCDLQAFGVWEYCQLNAKTRDPLKLEPEKPVLPDWEAFKKLDTELSIEQHDIHHAQEEDSDSLMVTLRQRRVELHHKMEYELFLYDIARQEYEWFLAQKEKAITHLLQTVDCISHSLIEESDPETPNKSPTLAVIMQRLKERYAPA